MLLNSGLQFESPRLTDAPVPVPRRANRKIPGAQTERKPSGICRSSYGSVGTSVAAVDEKMESTCQETVKAPLHSGMGYSFTPGGLLFPYYTGVMSALKDLGLLGPDTPVSGSSAGAIAVALIASGLEVEQVMEENFRFQSQMLQTGTFWKLADMMKTRLMDCLPDDIHLRASGRVGIAVSKYEPWKELEGMVVEDFADKEDFVDAVIASCYIPYYLGPGMGHPYRDGVYTDGMTTNFFPPLPRAAQPRTKKTVTVSALPKMNRAMVVEDNGVEICPDLRPRYRRYSTLGYIKIGLLPCPVDEVKKIIKDGYSDALQWGEKHLQQRIRESNSGH